MGAKETGSQSASQTEREIKWIRHTMRVHVVVRKCIANDFQNAKRNFGNIGYAFDAWSVLKSRCFAYCRSVFLIRVAIHAYRSLPLRRFFDRMIGSLPNCKIACPERPERSRRRYAPALAGNVLPAYRHRSRRPGH